MSNTLLNMDKQVADYQSRRLKGNLTNEEKNAEVELKQDVATVAARFKKFVKENEVCTS